MTTIAVIGGGLSLMGVDLSPLRGKVECIGINGVWQPLPWMDEIVTIDTVRLAERFKDCPVPVFAGVPDGYGTDQAGNPCDRAAKVSYINYLRRVLAPGLSEEIGTLHSGENSAFGAFNRAYHKRPRRIVLLGVDIHQMGKYWWAPGNCTGNRPQHERVSANFATALPQIEAAGIEVVNASPISRIACFPKCTPEEGVNLCLS